MDFEKYIDLVTWFLENDNREVNYQNRVMIPFLEEICKDLDVVDTSMLTKQWNNRGVGRDKFAGKYTPDLLIASKWKLKLGENIEYKALVEIKSPTANDRDHAEDEIKEYIEKVPFVILTDCITWEFFMKEDESIYHVVYSLEKEHQKVCKRESSTSIMWSNESWENIRSAIKNTYIIKEDSIDL